VRSLDWMVRGRALVDRYEINGDRCWPWGVELSGCLMREVESYSQSVGTMSCL
jgi:hypothetical protein